MRRGRPAGLWLPMAGALLALLALLWGSQVGGGRGLRDGA